MKTIIQILLVALSLLTASVSIRADTFYVPNAGANHVMQFTSTGTNSVFTNTSSHSLCAVFDTAGNVYVSIPSANSIHKFSSSGADLGVFATLGSGGGSAPFGLAFDSTGNLYAADPNDNTVKKFTPAGAGSVFATGLVYPTGLVFDDADNLYVANGNAANIVKFSSTGTNLGVFASSGGVSPYALAFDATGNLFVANNTSGGIAKITTNGSASTFAYSPGANPVGLAFDSAGILYASYNQLNNIKKFSSTGTDLGVFATNGLSSPMLFSIRPAPTLRIATEGNQSVLFWPTSGTNYILQSATDLDAPDWTTVTDAVPVTAVAVPYTSPKKFFRLVEP